LKNRSLGFIWGSKGQRLRSYGSKAFERMTMIVASPPLCECYGTKMAGTDSADHMLRILVDFGAIYLLEIVYD